MALLYQALIVTDPKPTKKGNNIQHMKDVGKNWQTQFLEQAVAKSCTIVFISFGTSETHTHTQNERCIQIHGPIVRNCVFVVYWDSCNWNTSHKMTINWLQCRCDKWKESFNAYHAYNALSHTQTTQIRRLTMKAKGKPLQSVRWHRTSSENFIFGIHFHLLHWSFLLALVSAAHAQVVCSVPAVNVLCIHSNRIECDLHVAYIWIQMIFRQSFAHFSQMLFKSRK